jgi:hypothetical protein
MNKRNIAKLEKLVEKLKTASPRAAYNAVCKLSDEDIFNNILHDLVKENFTIDSGIARSIIYNDLPSMVLLEICGMYEVEIFYYFSDDDLELKIVVAGKKQKKQNNKYSSELAKKMQELKRMESDSDADVDKLLELKSEVAAIRARHKVQEHIPRFSWASDYREWGEIEDFEGCLPPDIISKLSDFKEESSGLWTLSFGKIKSITQFKKEVLPVWNATLEMLKSFEEE